MEIIDLILTIKTLYGVGWALAAVGLLIIGVWSYRRLPDPRKEKIRAAWPKVVERIRTR